VNRKKVLTGKRLERGKVPQKKRPWGGKSTWGFQFSRKENIRIARKKKRYLLGKKGKKSPEEKKGSTECDRKRSTVTPRKEVHAKGNVTGRGGKGVCNQEGERQGRGGKDKGSSWDGEKRGFGLTKKTSREKKPKVKSKYLIKREPLENGGLNQGRGRTINKH